MRFVLTLLVPLDDWFICLIISFKMIDETPKRNCHPQANVGLRRSEVIQVTKAEVAGTTSMKKIVPPNPRLIVLTNHEPIQTAIGVKTPIRTSGVGKVRV